jgi:hypothetical protein
MMPYACGGKPKNLIKGATIPMIPLPGITSKKT